MHGKKRKPSGGSEQGPPKKPCPAPVPCQHGVLPKQFRDFFCAKAFDIISDNRYRKHMVKCKESGDVWALELQASISAIQQRIRRIHALLAETKGLQQSTLGRVCREASSARAPACRQTPAPVPPARACRPCLMRGPAAKLLPLPVY